MAYASITISCDELNALLSKAMKCILKGGSKIDPKTGMIQMTLKNNMLSFRTTDTRSTLIVRMPDVPGDDFTVVLEIEEFSKILPKQTVKELTLTVQDDVVELKGNGTYKLDIQMEDSGKLVFDDIPVIQNPEIAKQFDRKELVDIIKVSGKFIGTAFADPRVCGYYFSDAVITTDNVVASFYKKQLFDEKFLIHSTTFNLLESMTDDKVVFYKKGDQIQFLGDTFFIDAKIHPASDEYPEDILKEYLKEQYAASVIVDVKAISDAVDRVDVFASSVILSGEGSGVIFDFQEDHIQISDKRGKSVEYVPYVVKNNFIPFTCKVSCVDFINTVTLDGVSQVELKYSNDDALQVVAGDVVRILGYMEDDQSDMAIDEALNAMNDEIASTSNSYMNSDDIDVVDYEISPSSSSSNSSEDELLNLNW